MAVVVITGCSSGFGREAARRFGARGDQVWATMRRPADGDDLAEHGDITVHALDVNDDASVETCINAVLERDGRIDVLVNNAGVGFIGAVETSSWDLARTMMETNFWGAIRTIRAVLPAMRAQGEGRIVNVTSVAALIPASYNAFYSASKVALDRLSEALAWELTDHGIKVALVEPGFYATAITDKSIAAQGDIREGPYADIEQRVRDFYAKGVADGGDPTFVADKIVEVATVDDPPMRSICGPDAEMLVQGYETMSSEEFAAIGKSLMGL
jgi:NAD(P)-dependent dehydrogenase (short-subunit alcohol dehydrogenase family)